ncbi:MAG TPA: tetratricopeptide repeat protein [Candidatus Acidoferrum sp.]|nr:tetratricopeptide repeat protein [Candidatus Acidoferrum sp.]
MALVWRWILILLTFTLGCGQVLAASSRQDRAFQAAQAAFDAEMWSRAEAEFAAFAAKYPDSAATPNAWLMQAEAEIKQGDFTNAIRVLTVNQMNAGKLADQYVNWIGEAQYAGGHFPAAAHTFITLAEEFTNSPLRFSATVNAAAALGQLGEWRQVDGLLEAPGGVFQAGLRADAGNPMALRGQLLRAQARYSESNYAGAALILESRHLDTLPLDLAWPWAYWLCQVRIAADDLPGALTVASNLIQIARDSRNDGRVAGSLNLRAALYEKSQMTNEALADYEQNLVNTNTPPENQRQAVLKVASLLGAQNQFTNAETRLNAFLDRFPHSPAAPAALFSLGDLYLKDFGAQDSQASPDSVNKLQLAQACLDQFVGGYTNSEYLGHTYLDRGWCDWFASNYVASAADFQEAVDRLPHSLDLAVAHFKLGDALFMKNDFTNGLENSTIALANFTNALENYGMVVYGFTDLPEVAAKLGQPALYQSLRVSEAMKNQSAATDALDRILKLYPQGNLADNALLFYGEHEAARAGTTNLEAARALFRQFVAQFPHSELLPEVELAVARTYEQQGEWPAAITNYDSWLVDFPTNDLRAQTIYAAARAHYQAGDDTNALLQFTGFISQFPTHDLAPQAQWWVADYFFRASNYAGAETNYENIFQNPAWKSSPLIYPAQFMAGRAAMARNGYPDATRYFSTLISDTNCPPDLGVQARFACAAAWVQIPSTDTNNPLANFATAISFLTQIVQMNPTNADAARAWGEIGNCYFQLSNFDAAENDYGQVFGTNAPAAAAADVTARSAAMVGYGLVLEKAAESVTGVDRTNLLQAALDKYLDVFDTNVGKNLRDGEVADPFWVKKAGLQALPLIQSLGAGNPDKFIDQLEQLLPSLKISLEKTRLNLAAKK